MGKKDETPGTAIDLSRIDLDMREITDFKTALTALAAAGVVVEDGTEYGDGVVQVEKSDLIGARMLLIDWTFSEGDNGEYVVVRALAQTKLAKDATRVVFADGSTGIMAQLSAITEERANRGVVHPNKGLVVEKGLRVSEYTYTDDEGNDRDAATYYLSI